MADAEREDQAFKLDRPPHLDGGEQVAAGGLAKALIVLDALQIARRGIARGQREDFGRLLDQALLKEERDLLVAKPFNVECAARAEMP